MAAWEPRSWLFRGCWTNPAEMQPFSRNWGSCGRWDRQKRGEGDVPVPGGTCLQRRAGRQAQGFTTCCLSAGGVGLDLPWEPGSSFPAPLQPCCCAAGASDPRISQPLHPASRRLLGSPPGYACLAPASSQRKLLLSCKPGFGLVLWSPRAVRAGVGTSRLCLRPGGEQEVSGWGAPSAQGHLHKTSPNPSCFLCLAG